MSRHAVLRLYKNILRYGQHLRFTDKEYFRYRVRKAFKDNKSLTDEAAIDFQLQKGSKFLEAQRVV